MINRNSPYFRAMTAIVLFCFINNVFAEVKVAVLDFASSTGNEREDAMLSTGTTETIATDLTKVSNITVVERSKIEDVCKKLGIDKSGMIDEETAQKVGKMLGATHVIIGSWQKFDSYRLNAKMVEVETGKVIAASKKTGNRVEIFGIQDLMIEELFSQINIHLTVVEKKEIGVKETESMEAYESYSLAKEAQYRDEKDKAEYYAKEALSYDPNYQKAKTIIGKYGELMASFDEKYANALEEGGAKGLGKAWLANAAGTMLIWLPCLAGTAICVIVGAPDWATGVVFFGTLIGACAIYVNAKEKKQKTKRISLQLPSYPIYAENSAHAFAYHQQLQKENSIKISATLFRLYF